MRFSYLSLLLLLLMTGCEFNEKEEICRPVQVKTTSKLGAVGRNVLKEFKYVEGRLDRINWSEYRSDYYSYDESGRLKSVSRKYVKDLVRQETWYSYEDDLSVRLDEVEISLDRYSHLNQDTTFIGYKERIFDGKDLMEEAVYLRNPADGLYAVSEYKYYTYDDQGNVSKYVSLTDVEGDTLEVFAYEYDFQKNPFYYVFEEFDGESYVNNIISKTDLLNDIEYTYQIIYTGNGFPEQINIKEGDNLSEVISIVYECD